MRNPAIILLGVIAALCICIAHANVTIVTRQQWGARAATGVTAMRNPVQYVVIHHSYIPGACTTAAACEASMRSMQNSHMNANGWNDIGYSFAVGGDGRAYTGRGWSAVGAHAPGYNDRSIGICVIGDWSNDLPPKNQLHSVKVLIDYGVRMGYIKDDFQLLGHRETRATECPGDALFAEVKRWRNPDLTAKKNYEDFEEIDNVIP